MAKLSKKRAIWAPAEKWSKYMRDCCARMDEEAREATRRGLMSMVKLALFRRQQQEQKLAYLIQPTVRGSGLKNFYDRRAYSTSNLLMVKN